MSRKLALVTFAFLLASIPSWAAAADAPKRVLLLGTKRDHPPGCHEYMTGLNVLAATLKKVPGLDVQVLAADEPWPEGPELIKKADAVVLNLGQGARWEQVDPKRYEALKDLAARGGAIVGIHWAIGAKDAQYIEGHLALMGGCHGGPDRKYILTETDVQVSKPRHPIARGIDDFRLDDEYYYRLKFAKQGTVTPVLAAVIDGRPETVAWTFERPDGGRSFGFSGMHYHANWKRPELRRLLAQAVLWTLKLPIPEKGLSVDVPDAVYEIKDAGPAPRKKKRRKPAKPQA